MLIPPTLSYRSKTMIENPQAEDKFKLKAQKFLKIYEYIIGVTIILKGTEELPHFHHHPLSVGFIFFAGVFIILATTFHHQFEKRVKHGQGVFHILEGMVEMITAFILFQGTKKMIPFFLFFIGVVYFIMGIVEHYQTPENKERLMRQFGFWMGFAFITFSCAISIFNLLTTNKPAVYLMTVLMVWIGWFLIYLKNTKFDPKNKFHKYLNRS